MSKVLIDCLTLAVVVLVVALEASRKETTTQISNNVTSSWWYILIIDSSSSEEARVGAARELCWFCYTLLCSIAWVKQPSNVLYSLN